MNLHHNSLTLDSLERKSLNQLMRESTSLAAALQLE